MDDNWAFISMPPLLLLLHGAGLRCGQASFVGPAERSPLNICFSLAALRISMLWDCFSQTAAKLFQICTPPHRRAPGWHSSYESAFKISTKWRKRFGLKYMGFSLTYSRSKLFGSYMYACINLFHPTHLFSK